jgi:hypothetical protein
MKTSWKQTLVPGENFSISSRRRSSSTDASILHYTFQSILNHSQIVSKMSSNTTPKTGAKSSSSKSAKHDNPKTRGKHDAVPDALDVTYANVYWYTTEDHAVVIKSRGKDTTDHFCIIATGDKSSPFAVRHVAPSKPDTLFPLLKVESKPDSCSMLEIAEAWVKDNGPKYGTECINVSASSLNNNPMLLCYANPRSQDLFAMELFLIDLGYCKTAKTNDALRNAIHLLELLFKKKNATSKIANLRNSKATQGTILGWEKKITDCDREIKALIKGKSSRSQSGSRERSRKGKDPAQSGKK